MKTYIPYSLLAAVAASGLAYGAETAYTTPVGYVTETLRPGQYNLTGLTLQSPVAVAGVLTGSTATSVSASAVNFTTSLTAGKTYILELADGTVQEITAWSGSTLTTPDNITSHVTNGTTTFKLRAAATVSSVFGAQNSAGLTPSPDGDVAACDVIIVSTPSGPVTIYFFNDGAGTTGWYTAQGDPADNFVLSYPDGYFVQRVAGSIINLVVSGEVKKAATAGVLVAGYNYMAGVAPVGLTLANSGLQNYISHSADGDPATVDTVLLPTPGGSYKTCYFFDDGAGTTGWYTAQGDPADTEPVGAGFLILNLGGTKPVKVSVPASYSTL